MSTTHNMVVDALRFGLATNVTKLLHTSILEDPDRVLIPVSQRFGKRNMEDVMAYIECCKMFATHKFDGLHVAQIREAILSIDSEYKHMLSKSPNAMWRFTWARQESAKLSEIWRMALRGIKRDAFARCDAINRLKQIWYHVVLLVQNHFQITASNFLGLAC